MLFPILLAIWANWSTDEVTGKHKPRLSREEKRELEVLEHNLKHPESPLSYNDYERELDRQSFLEDVLDEFF